MSNVRTFMFIVAIPAIIALGHDAYLFINDGADVGALTETLKATGTGAPDAKSLFSALGWIWTEYHPPSYEWVVRNAQPGTWKIINAFLELKALYFGVLFAGFFYSILLAMKVMKKGPFAGSSGKFTGKKGEKMAPKRAEKFKYKRK